MQKLYTSHDVKEQGKKVKVTFVGKTGDDKESIRAYVKDIGLENVVTFLDPVPEKDMQKLYTSHDVLVLPSYNEAIGLAVPEAMACGLPTITSDTVGANVYVKKDVTGYIYVTYNVKELAECIVKIHNRERIIAMGQAARAQVLGFSIKNGVSTFLKAIA
jgi:glycosyltransferase involved in cell wall biosynthesis